MQLKPANEEETAEIKSILDEDEIKAGDLPPAFYDGFKRGALFVYSGTVIPVNEDSAFMESIGA